MLISTPSSTVSFRGLEVVLPPLITAVAVVFAARFMSGGTRGIGMGIFRIGDGIASAGASLGDGLTVIGEGIEEAGRALGEGLVAIGSKSVPWAKEESSDLEKGEGQDPPLPKAETVAKGAQDTTTTTKDKDAVPPKTGQAADASVVEALEDGGSALGKQGAVKKKGMDAALSKMGTVAVKAEEMVVAKAEEMVVATAGEMGVAATTKKTEERK
jgi:hypothetical protein